jgi:serine/threonine protein kinase
LERELLSFQTLRAFPHPNVVRMLDYFTGSREDRSPATTGEPSSRRISSVLKVDEFFYMVFEACASDLYVAYMKNPLGRAGCKPIPELSKHFLDVARGVAHLHGLGLVHGDLSMSNILVGDDCRARVADLGTAHSCHALLAGSPAFKGTSYARAPEIWMDARHSTKASDAWSVGVIAIVMMSGVVPGVESLQNRDGEEKADAFEHWLKAWVDILGQPQRGTCPTLTMLAKWKDIESSRHQFSEVAAPSSGSDSRLAPLQRYFSLRPTERPLGSQTVVSVRFPGSQVSQNIKNCNKK